MKLVDYTIENFIKETASSSPAPGGGSVSALAGSISSALANMVVELTVNKKAFASLDESIKLKISSLTDELAKAQADFLNLVDEDTLAFNGFMKALAMPKQTEDEKKLRNKAMQEATVKALNVPAKTARLCLQVLKLLEVLITHGNKNAVSDVGVSALMARSGAMGALLNVRINLLGLEDEALKAQMLNECNQIESEVSSIEKSLLQLVMQKLN